jgi:hypothetical protein
LLRLSIEDDLWANPSEPSGGKVQITGVTQESHEAALFADLDSVKNARVSSRMGTPDRADQQAQFDSGPGGRPCQKMTTTIDASPPS